jgi:hypothetical protein
MYEEKQASNDVYNKNGNKQSYSEEAKSKLLCQQIVNETCWKHIDFLISNPSSNNKWAATAQSV